MLVQDWIEIDGWRIRFSDIVRYGTAVKRLGSVGVTLGCGVQIITRDQAEPIFVACENMQAAQELVRQLDLIGAVEDGVTVAERRSLP